MVVLHHLENSRSQRVLWLLEALGVPYEVKRYERNKTTMLAPPELKAVHPLGKSPVITDHDGDGEHTIAESGAIIEYLIGRYGNGRLIPAEGTPQRLRYTYWLHYAEGSAMPLMVMKLVFSHLSSPPMPFVMRPVAGLISTGVQRKWLDPQIDLHLNYIESELGKSPWFAGDAMTGADIQMSFPLEAAASRGGLDQRYPKMTGFLRRIHALPAYQRALEKGGPYRLLS